MASAFENMMHSIRGDESAYEKLKRQRDLESRIAEEKARAEAIAQANAVLHEKNLAAERANSRGLQEDTDQRMQELFRTGLMSSGEYKPQGDEEADAIASRNMARGKYAESIVNRPLASSAEEFNRYKQQQGLAPWARDIGFDQGKAQLARLAADRTGAIADESGNVNRNQYNLGLKPLSFDIGQSAGQTQLSGNEATSAENAARKDVAPVAGLAQIGQHMLGMAKNRTAAQIEDATSPTQIRQAIATSAYGAGDTEGALGRQPLEQQAKDYEMQGRSDYAKSMQDPAFISARHNAMLQDALLGGMKSTALQYPGLFGHALGISPSHYDMKAPEAMLNAAGTISSALTGRPYTPMQSGFGNALPVGTTGFIPDTTQGKPETISEVMERLKKTKVGKP